MKPVQERRRELNRLAAQKLRSRQKERAFTIRQEYFSAQSNNTRLVYEKKQLFKEREVLRMSLEAHLQICQQQTQTQSIIIGNHLICLASPASALAQPIFITDVDHSTTGQTNLAASDSENDALSSTESHDADSDKEEEDSKLLDETPAVKKDQHDGEVVPLVIAEDNLVNQESSPDSQMKKETIDNATASLEMPVTKSEIVENVSKLHSCIPLMVLDMNDS